MHPFNYSFTRYKFTNHSRSLQVNHVLHTFNATVTNSRSKLPPSVSLWHSGHALDLFCPGPGSIPGDEAHPIFSLYEASHVSKEADVNPLGLLIYLLAAGGARKVNLQIEGRP